MVAEAYANFRRDAGMIEVRNVTKRYGKLAALEDLELKIEKSSVYGLVEVITEREKPPCLKS